jgi:uridine kinase
MQSTRERILSAIPKVGSSVFVAIDGHGGSGKSTLADLLGTQLGATVVHIDEFAGWDNRDWWPEVIDRVFGPVSEGASIVTYQPSSWGENHHPEPVTKPVTPIMILEGVSSSRTEFADYIGFRIFVDTPQKSAWSAASLVIRLPAKMRRWCAVSGKTGSLKKSSTWSEMIQSRRLIW